MELEILVSIAIGLLSILLLIITKLKRASPAAAANQEPAANDAAQNRRVPRRAVVARNARNRLQAPVVRNSDSEHEAEADSDDELANEKLGAKKRAKLEAKAERQKMREVEERSREDRRKQREIEDEERLKEQEKEKKEELKREAEEKRALAEKEAKEQEEYEKMKAMFSVEDEGCEVAEEDDQRNMLQEFVNYIKDTKVVVLEDLAAHFHLKTQNAIDRIHDLQTEGRLTGVLDDRGKFIYVSQSELEEVAKFVKQRGRVSRTDLAESSNRLISLKTVRPA